MDHLDFALLTSQNGIEAVEYVNQFFKDKAGDQAYLKEMKDRADSEGVKSLLIMVDGEGALGASEEKERIQTVENHKKWVEAARFLGCHSIRVNGYSSGDFRTDDYYESQKLVADGLHRLCEFAEDYELNVLIENHGGHSSHAPWLMGVMRKADHPLAGTLPDFGNFRISPWGEEDNILSYDSYRGTAELMPLAQGVSLKTQVFDDFGNRSELDYDRMMRIVLDAGYRGHVGIEHGEEGREWESVVEVKEKLLACRKRLAPEYEN
jgi:sugar phosphate isomerase/epimerase